MNKRHVALIFVAGAVAGGYLHAWLMPTPKWPVPPGELSAHQAAPTPALRQIVAQPVQAQLSNLAERRPTMSALAAVEAAPSQPAAEEHSSTLTLTLDEGLIKEIEDNGDRLRDSVYSETSDQGWRIRILRQDDLLVRSGLHDGDLVTYDGLNAQFGRAGRGDLAERVAAILNSIKR